LNIKYICSGVIRRHVPEKILFAVMKHRGDGSIAETAGESYIAHWNGQLRQRGWDFVGRRVLEVGSGRYARFALQMLAAGASEVTLIDLYAESLDAPAHRAMLLDECARLGFDFEDVRARIHSIRGDITTLPPVDADQRVDIAISHAVLEHVRDPKAILSRCWDWLKPGGITHHMIDLRDHNLQFQYPFEMLTFSDHVWSRWFDLGGGFHLNRWRASDYLKAAHEVGFVDLSYEAILQDATELRKVRPRLNEHFRNVPTDILAILSMYLSGEKPCDLEQTP
jgi:SAM-dependent methyltransferase